MQLNTLLLLSLTLAGVQAWQAGRATFYGMDGWSIHTGSCGYGYQWPDVSTGGDVVAIADASPEFSSSCGRCYEVRSRDADFTDGYGEKLARSGICYDSSQSVAVGTTDACPCEYHINAYSNRRWCCGDGGMTHMDLSLWAFEKLAPTSLGAFAIEYRRVSCDHQPNNPAPTLSGGASPGEDPPSDAVPPSGDECFVQRFDDFGQRQGAVSPCQSGSQQSSSDDNNNSGSSSDDNTNESSSNDSNDSSESSSGGGGSDGNSNSNSSGDDEEEEQGPIARFFNLMG